MRSSCLVQCLMIISSSLPDPVSKIVYAALKIIDILVVSALANYRGQYSVFRDSYQRFVNQ